MIREQITATLQSKNALMFITSVIFMAGILSYFNDCELICAGILTVIGIFLIIRRSVSYKYILFWLFIFYFGFFNSYFRINSSDDLSEIAPIDGVIEGQVVSIPNTVKDRTKFFVNVNSIDGKPIKAKTYITVEIDENDPADFTIGNYYKFNAKIRLPFKAGNPSQFDYGNYLRNFNAFTASYTEQNSCEKLDKELSVRWKFMHNLNSIRNGIINSHAKYLQSPNLEILGGIVFGDDAVAPPDYIKTTFINSGLLHILAASGMNVAFIFGFWFCIMRFLHVPYRINIIGGIIMVILYTLMTGLGASVLRAALMLLFIQIGKLIDRDAHSISLLAFVAFLLLIYNPAYINDVGFQLSFIVTFGLLTMANVIFERMKELKAPDWVKAGFLIPIVAQIWVAPIQMFYFNTFSSYSILANIATVPFLSVISFGGFVSSILSAITPIANFVCMIFDFVLKYFLDIVVAISNYFAQLPASIITTTHPGILQILLYYFILLAITFCIKIGFSKKLLITIASSVIILLLTTINIPNHNLEIITFDVGNADSLLIKTPQNKYFLIDTAKLSYKSGNSTAKMVIIKYLKDRGIRELEGLVLTHFDLDHAGGTVDILKELNVKKIYVNSMDKSNFTINNIFDTANELKIPLILAANNSKMYEEEDLTLTNYLANIPKNDNENSIVTLLKYKDFDVLFTGDAGAIALAKLKPILPPNVEVLKVGHHGARNVISRDIINHLGTQVSIISTGPNSFGHPAVSTLDILRNTEIYRTDMHNSIKITTDGYKYKLYTYDRTKHRYTDSQELQTITQ